MSLHVPVLLDEVIDWLAPRPGGVYVDGTLGGGGHTRRLAEAVGGEGIVIALDRDPAAIDRAAEVLAGLPIKLVQANFALAPEVLMQTGTPRVNGILLDLGLSSDQLADEARGFSFDSAGPLDLRMDPDEGEPAAALLDRLREKDLADLIYAYGEERFSRRIARAIVRRRAAEPIRTARELAGLVRRVVPRSGKIDAATRTFQALRIAVNDELKSLETALACLPDCLAEDGRMAIISFHSLEDRRVKQAFAGDHRLEALTRKPIRATEAEIAKNPRSRSAKLRVAKRKPT